MDSAVQKLPVITRNVSEGPAKLSLANALTRRVGITQAAARLNALVDCVFLGWFESIAFAVRRI